MAVIRMLTAKGLLRDLCRQMFVRLSVMAIWEVYVAKQWSRTPFSRRDPPEVVFDAVYRD